MKLKIPYISDNDNGMEKPSRCQLQLDCVNWKNEYPYHPEVKVNLWHNNNSLFLEYEVNEDFIAAITSQDNGEVWKDSCVELFISFDNEGYYNIEANCIGKILMSHRQGRKVNVEYAPKEILKLIKRNPSLGEEVFNCKKATAPWKMTLEIPVAAFFKHKLNGLQGVEAKCNIYKCGDMLPSPHFISLFPIDTEKPDFHRPEFFGNICFE